MGLLDVDYGNLFKDLVYDTLVKQAVSKLLSKMVGVVTIPIFGPFIGSAISFLITYVANLIYAPLDEFVDMKQIVLKDKDLQKKYDTESLKLKVIAQEKGIDSPEFKKERDVSKQALANFVSLKSVANSVQANH